MTNKKFDAVVVGELNVDIILNDIRSFPEIGKEILADKMEVTLGSSSGIFASNLSSLGAKVAFISRVGNDNFGAFLIDELRKKGVDVNGIIKDENVSTGATVILNYDNDRAMITYPGAMNNLTLNDVKREIVSQAKHLHFSSYYLQPGIKKDVQNLFSMAKELELTISFDMQWDPDEKWDMDYQNVLKFVDVFLPNEQEILHLTGERNLEKAIEKISNTNSKIVVKIGKKGSLLNYGKETITGNPFTNDNVVDAIGAGDSFNAGFIYKFLENAEDEECLEFANLMGAVSTTAAGGTTAFKDFQRVMKIAKDKFGYSKA